MVEHLHGMQGVNGSTPFSSTILIYSNAQIREKGGQYVPTECGVILFSDGSEEEFYTDKAIKEIALKQNPR